MALWNKLGSRGNVEDRRMMPGGVGIGGLGLTGIAIVVAVTLLTGGSATDVINNLQNVQVGAPTQQITSAEFDGADSYETFVSTVLGSLNDTWKSAFSQMNASYIEPKLVLFRGGTQSACGGAQSVFGPHYCPLDSTIYLDETFFKELTTRYGAEGGDVAEAYVIAHEAGHHAQNELGLDYSESNGASIKTELQADCFAGLWAYSIKDLGVLSPGEIEEAINAAQAVGDDRIQKNTTGRINPEAWTHGSAADRALWFTRGFETGSLAACDTFAD